MNFPTIVQVPVNYGISPLNYAKNSIHSTVDHTKSALNKVKAAAHCVSSAFCHAGSSVKSNVNSAVTKMKPAVKCLDAKLTQVQNSRFVAALPEKSTMQRVLLALTTGLAVLSLVPPLKLGASLSLRSIAVLSSTTNCAESWSKSGALSRAVKVAKVGAVTLGLIGVVAASPALLVASIGADIGIQVFETSKAIYQGRPDKAIIHFSAVVIDSFVLAGTVTGSWPLMVTAASISTAVMTGLSIKSFAELFDTDSPKSGIDAFCYLVLAGVGVASAISASEIKYSKITKGHYEYKNNTNYKVFIYDRNNERICTAKPGETVSFDLEKSKMGRHYGSVWVNYNGPKHNTYIYPKKFEYETSTLKTALSPKLFPTLPVGGTAIVTHDLT